VGEGGEFEGGEEFLLLPSCFSLLVGLLKDRIEGMEVGV
jgi:hypothetical protein